jgi:hypothetical protein
MLLTSSKGDAQSESRLSRGGILRADASSYVKTTLRRGF